MGWYFTITEEMRATGLKGYDLLVFAVINAYSQRGEGCFYGSASTLGEMVGIEKRSALRTLRKLTDSGYLKKGDIYKGGVKYCAYQAVADRCQKVTDDKKTPVTKSASTGDNLSHNNKDIYKNNTVPSNTRTREKSVHFVAPTVEEVAQFCAERGNGIDAEAFVAFYASKGWKIGTTPMKDWRAAVVTWEKRDAQRAAEAQQQPARRHETAFEHNLREYDRMLGTNLHDQYYGKQ